MPLISLENEMSYFNLLKSKGLTGDLLGDLLMNLGRGWGF